MPQLTVEQYIQVDAEADEARRQLGATEDDTDEGRVRALETLTKITDEVDSTVIRTITHQQVERARWRRQKRMQRDRQRRDLIAWLFSETSLEPEEEVVRRDQRRRLFEGIPRKHWKVVYKSIFEKLSDKEIAFDLGITTLEVAERREAELAWLRHRAAWIAGILAALLLLVPITRMVLNGSISGLEPAQTPHRKRPVAPSASPLSAAANVPSLPSPHVVAPSHTHVSTPSLSPSPIQTCIPTLELPVCAVLPKVNLPKLPFCFSTTVYETQESLDPDISGESQGINRDFSGYVNSMGMDSARENISIVQSFVYGKPPTRNGNPGPQQRFNFSPAIIVYPDEINAKLGVQAVIYFPNSWELWRLRPGEQYVFSAGRIPTVSCTKDGKAGTPLPPGQYLMAVVPFGDKALGRDTITATPQYGFEVPLHL